MRSPKQPAPTLHRNNNQTIISKADSKLNDVLINGVRLHFFKSSKNKTTISSNKNHHYQSLIQTPHQEQGFHLEQGNLFKNNAIRRRLKSLQAHPNPIEATAPKKFTPYKQIVRIPLQTINMHSKASQQLQAQPLNVKANTKKYQNELKKDLVLYSTINRFNSSSYKNRIQHGKYIGLTSHKHKRIITERQSTLIQQKFDKMDKEYREKQLSLSIEKQSFGKSAQIEPNCASQHYRSITTQPQQANHSMLQMYTKHQSQRQKLKICYSNKYQLKKWKEYLHQMVEKNRHEVPHQEKIFTTLSSDT